MCDAGEVLAVVEWREVNRGSPLTHHRLSGQRVSGQACQASGFRWHVSFIQQFRVLTCTISESLNGDLDISRADSETDC